MNKKAQIKITYINVPEDKLEEISQKEQNDRELGNSYSGWNKDKHMSKILSFNFLKRTSENENKSRSFYI